MATWEQQIQQIETLRGRRDQLDQDLYASSVNLEKQKNQLEQAIRSQPNLSDQQKRALQDQVVAAQEKNSGLKKDHIHATANLYTAINGLYVETKPQQLIENLTDSIPIALLPVRLETRFSGNELLLRIYPDDIAIHTHEKMLTDQEVDAGKAYWAALYLAITGNAADAEDNKKAAWNNLVTHFGAGRAAWVAMQTKPTNWSNDLSGISSSDKLVFPVFDLTKTMAWSRAPRTKVLPDKFIVRAYSGNAIAIEQTGNTIPDELVVGPDPGDSQNSFVANDNRLQFGPDFDWTSDFDKAVANGMGFRLVLNRTQAEKGFDRIIVLGLYMSSTADSSRQKLEELIDNHHFSPQGFSLVIQGSPTNNTDDSSSAFSKKDPFNTLSYYVETGTPLFTATDDCDGRNLANALGISYSVLQYVANADATDLREAVMMNKALYPATLGYYISVLLSPAIDQLNQQQLRLFFENYVTGRGPVPAFRVGNQPYGVLLTSDFSAWQWQQRELAKTPAFLANLYKILQDYQAIWASLLPQLNFAGMPGKDPSDVLMNILGLQPSSVSFFQRNAYTTEDVVNRDAFQYNGNYTTDVQKNFTSKMDGLSWLQLYGYNQRDASNALIVPQILKLIYQPANTPLDEKNLIDGLPLSETNLIRYYDDVNKKNYLDWLIAATSANDLENQSFGNGVQPPNALLYLLLRKALLQELGTATVNFFNNAGVDFTQVLAPVNAFNIRPGGTLTKWEVMKAPVSTAIPAHPQQDMEAASYLLGPGKMEIFAANLGEMKAAIAELRSKPTARLERCLVEHLDTLTYRLDSWQMAMFQTRLQSIRNSPAPASNTQSEINSGIWLGAYGILEDVRPSPRSNVDINTIPAELRPPKGESVYRYADNGGYVHAPSINQASAAAVLRSAYLSHASAGNPDLMSVNLSSERIRRALAILDGMHNGQSLEVLLGYQFERGLHDRASANNSLINLNLYIYNFRDKYTIQTTLVQQQGNTPQQTIPANNVVNGLTLAQFSGGFPYGASGEVTGAQPDERKAIEEEKDKLNDTLDALNDLLTSESVYQIIQGNFDRAGAVLNSLKDATIPPEIDVIDTPRGTRFSLTNRVTILFENGDPDNPATNPWPAVAMTARAKFETGLNKWIGGILGDPTKLAVRVSEIDSSGNPSNPMTISMDHVKIQPIDLVYMTATEPGSGEAGSGGENKTGVSELESRIALVYRQAASIDDSVQVSIEFFQPKGATGIRPLGELTPSMRTLKSMLTDSRYLNAQDFNAPNDNKTIDQNNPKGWNAADLAARIDRCQKDYAGAINNILSIPIDAQVDDGKGNITFYATLKDTFARLDAAKLTFSDIIFDLKDPDSATLQAALINASNQAFGDAFPKSTITGTNDAKIILLEQARGISKRMQAAHTNAMTQITDAGTLADINKKTEKLISAGKVLLGDVFTIMPLFTYNNEADILASGADRNQLLDYSINTLQMDFPVDEWMQSSSLSRPRLARWDYVRLLTEASGSGLDLNPVQVPYRTKDSWIAIEFPQNDPSDPSKPFGVSQNTLSLVIHGSQAFQAGVSHSGILVDEWTESIPVSEEITGITFNFNQPNAFPPQSVLLAVPPVLKGHWEWEELMGVINDTFLRAKLRAVDPDLLSTVNKVQCNVLLPALLSNFTEYDLDFSLDYRLNLASALASIPILTASSKS